jgi:gamma-glutamylcyclotransferase (GGCT)/AIG2-like uncharacterized protein YtfP
MPAALCCASRQAAGAIFALGPGFALYPALVPAYNKVMANALESKTEEAQAVGQLEQSGAQLEEKQVAARMKAEQTRKIQALRLTRARIREQLARTSNERYRLLLNTELQQIESDLADLA